MVRALLFAIAFAALGTVSVGQVTEERIAELERRLAAEKTRGDRQARRIEELELTLVNVLAKQDEQEQVLAPSALEGLIAEQVAAAAGGRRGESAFSIRGTGRFVVRFFDRDEISTDESIELEHLMVDIDIRLEDDVRAEFTPGASHKGALFVLEAYLGWRPTEWIDVQVGRFIVPFSGRHAWAFPSDSFIEPYLAENAPKPFMYGPWWDEGAMVSGSFAFGAEDQHEFRFAGYVLNGFDAAGLDGIHKRSLGDNNKNKTLGGRATVTFAFGDARLTLGVAGLTGKYDIADELDFYAVEVDIEFSIGDFSLYVEAFHRPMEISATVIENPAATVREVSKLTGLKVRPEFRVASELKIFAQADWLFVRQPPRTGGQFSVTDLEDEEFGIRTYLVGFQYAFTANVRFEVEAGLFDRDEELGKDLPFVAFSIIYYF